MSGTMLYINNENRNNMVLLEKYDNYKKMRDVYQWKFLCEVGRAFAIPGFSGKASRRRVYSNWVIRMEVGQVKEVSGDPSKN